MEITDLMDELGKAMRKYEDAQLQFDLENRELVETIATLKDAIRPAILKGKETVKSQCLEARYRKGAVKWNTSWIDGFAIEHPEYELGKYRKVGEPTVAFVLRSDDGWDEGM